MVSLAKINNPAVKKLKVLVAPLDWGLGHATRCIPIIKELLTLTCEVQIAATGDQKALLEEEFPFLTIIELPGYGIKYGKNRAFTLFKMLAAIPKILILIKRENQWLRRFIDSERPDAVISDNRYGLYAKGLFSVFITHQLAIQTPFGGVGNRLLQRINYRYINRHSLCWVPDLEKEPSLAGSLSHPVKLPDIPVRYIGVLSRFESEWSVVSGEIGEPGIADLLIILSGPEPQRSIFEQALIRQLASWPGTAMLVRGRPGKKGGRRSTIAELASEWGEEGAGIAGGIPGLSDRLKIYDHLSAKTLNTVICRAEWVIARSGYSSIMDLLKLDKKCILVPTPGQTEQEYLGAWLSSRQLALCRSQKEFSLPEALAAARQFPYKGIGPLEKGKLGIEVKAFLEAIGKRQEAYP